MSLVLFLFCAVFALPETLSDRLHTLEQQVKVRELEQKVQALSEVNEQMSTAKVGFAHICGRSTDVSRGALVSRWHALASPHPSRRAVRTPLHREPRSMWPSPRPLRTGV